jgi:hypothetical protein
LPQLVNKRPLPNNIERAFHKIVPGTTRSTDAILPSHGAVSHAEVVGFPLDPVPGVVLVSQGVVVQLLEHTVQTRRDYGSSCTQ